MASVCKQAMLLWVLVKQQAAPSNLSLSAMNGMVIQKIQKGVSLLILACLDHWLISLHAGIFIGAVALGLMLKRD